MRTMVDTMYMMKRNRSPRVERRSKAEVGFFRLHPMSLFSATIEQFVQGLRYRKCVSHPAQNESPRENRAETACERKEMLIVVEEMDRKWASQVEAKRDPWK
mmetsp:Transcript_11225/g.22968  ORF Transcript_11225/g.22968 Transcript_11225/m.22968 type:complete len:102 (+) Transcript_11225:626-931(+)